MIMAEDRKILWTPEQVGNLNAYQRAGIMHPFTCGNRHPGERELVATIYGWICTCCDWQQGWAHDFMLDGSALKQATALLEKLNAD
jgi:hypothetical protein